MASDVGVVDATLSDDVVEADGSARGTTRKSKNCMASQKDTRFVIPKNKPFVVDEL